jgi:hypothetical protein
MAMLWRRALRQGGTGDAAGKPAHLRARLAINGLGAATTGVALAVILAAKFLEGAWLTVLVVPLTILLLCAVCRYYADVDRQLLAGRHRRIDLRTHAPPVALVPIKRWDRLARRAVEYALRLSPDVTALHLAALEGPDVAGAEEELRREWRAMVQRPAEEAGLRPPRLMIVNSEFRSVIAPLLRAIEEAEERTPGRPVTIVLPELVEGRWWGYLMHTNRERRLRSRILRHGGPNVAVASVPWQLQEGDPATVIAEEEPPEPAAAAANAQPDPAMRRAV